MTPSKRPDLTSRLERLMQNCEPQPSFAEIAAGLTPYGVQITPAYVQALVRGKRVNPTVDVVKALARFFGCQASELIDDARPAASAKLTRVLLRAADELSPEGLAMIEQMANNVLHYEKRRDDEEPHGPAEH